LEDNINGCLGNCKERKIRRRKVKEREVRDRKKRAEDLGKMAYILRKTKGSEIIE
jgi:hypothetical protein